MDIHAWYRLIGVVLFVVVLCRVLVRTDWGEIVAVSRDSLDSRVDVLCASFWLTVLVPFGVWLAFIAHMALWPVVLLFYFFVWLLKPRTEDDL